MDLALFRAGDVYIDYPYEDAKFRFEHATGRYFRRFYGQAEQPIDPGSQLLRDAIAAGNPIAREDYYRD